MYEFAKKRYMACSTMSNVPPWEGGKSQRFVKRPLLAEHQQEFHAECCRCLLNDLKQRSEPVLFFPDEKTFMVDPAMNKQKDQVVCFKDTPTRLHRITKSRREQDSSMKISGDFISLYPLKRSNYKPLSHAPLSR